METRLTKIGNSKGIIIPAHILRECALGEKISMAVENGRLVLSSSGPAHLADWDAQFKAAGAPHLLTQEEQEWLDVPNEWDDQEWTW